MSFYRVIETLMKVWENSKKLWKHSSATHFPTAFLIHPNFHLCFYNLTQRVVCIWPPCCTMLQNHASWSELAGLRVSKTRQHIRAQHFGESPTRLDLTVWHLPKCCNSIPELGDLNSYKECLKILYIISSLIFASVPCSNCARAQRANHTCRMKSKQIALPCGLSQKLDAIKT